MTWFFGGESTKDDDIKKKNQEVGASNGLPGAVAVSPTQEPDIPLITDAVVVHDEETYSRPPPTNPECVRTTNFPAATVENMMPPQARLPANNMMVPYQPGHLTKPTGTYSNLGRNPVGLQCPCCHRQTITVVQDRMGLETMVAIFLLALFFWPLCWLPLCMPSCKNTNHYCGHSECRRRIGETSACA